MSYRLNGDDDMDAILNSMSSTIYPVEKELEKVANVVDSEDKKKEISEDVGIDNDSSITPPEKDSIWNPFIKMKEEILQSSEVSKSVPKWCTANVECLRYHSVSKLHGMLNHMVSEFGVNLPKSVYEGIQLHEIGREKEDPLIPSNFRSSLVLQKALLDLGIAKRQITKICNSLSQSAKKFLRNIEKERILDSQSRIRVSESSGFQCLTLGNTSTKLSKSHYEKLRVLFDRNCSKFSISPKKFHDMLFCLLLRYDALVGGGCQAALNEECFDSLLEHFECKMECFASPLNCRYANYCSAFLDTDAPFGSCGSFFKFFPSKGSFQANPPFIPELIEKMAKHMTKLLESADGALSFIIIIPAWQDTLDHGYCEGKQEQRPTRWRIASFDTSVFFWQNELAMQKWPVTEKALSSLIHSFQSKQADERVSLGFKQGGKRAKPLTTLSKENNKMMKKRKLTK